jgi:hypothetical protein
MANQNFSDQNCFIIGTGIAIKLNIDTHVVLRTGNRARADRIERKEKRERDACSRATRDDRVREKRRGWIGTFEQTTDYLLLSP